MNIAYGCTGEYEAALNSLYTKI